MNEIIESDVAKPYGVIYKWTNKISGKAYIGQTTQDPEKRRAEHLYTSSDSVISRAIRKYGVENFDFEVIDSTATNQDELDAREKYWSEYYHTWIGDPECWGYNVRECGGAHGAWPQDVKDKISQSKIGTGMGADNPFYGKHHTEETKRVISEHHTLYYSDPEHRQSQSHPLSSEQKGKLSASLRKYYETHESASKGRHLSDETKAKLSVAPHLKGESHPWWGRHHTQETKDKISQAKKGKQVGEENPFYGKHHSVETRQKLKDKAKTQCAGEGNPMYGKKHTEEAKRKMSEAKQHYIRGNHPGAQRVRCIETGQVFECMQDAAEWAGVTIQSLSNYFTQNRKKCGNYTWEKISKEENN